MSFRSLTFLVFALSTFACECATPGASCSADTDCTGAGRCDTQRSLCVECATDEHCASGYVCSDNSCQPGCRADDASCAPGYCQPGEGCVQCVLDGHCNPGERCVEGECLPGCSEGGLNCPVGQLCDASSGVCVECLDDSQCHHAPLTTCDPTSRTCVECTTSAACPGDAPVCDPLSRTCVECVGNGDCAQGICHQQQCVECLSDSQCGGVTPRCELATNTCVACLPGATDNCPSGQYCRPDFTCEQGCRSGADCPSGVCLPSHSCQGCTADSQCAAGNVCDNGTCVGACGAENLCASGETCCNGHCAPLQNDAANCGACGVACGSNRGCCAGACTNVTTLNNCGACGVVCGADQFCDGSQCQDKTFPNFCSNLNVVAIRDGIPNDNAATTVLASTLTQYCSATTAVTFANDDDPAVVEQQLPDGGPSGRLLLGGAYSVVTAGGPFPNLPVRWLERSTRVTPVYFANNLQGSEFYFKRRLPADAGVADPTLVTRLQSECTAVDGGLGGDRRDVFLVELAIDPSSGTLALIAYGLCSPGTGTLAGSWFWANVMLPNRAAYPGSWYIVEWTDTDGDFAPSAGDTFTVLQHD